MGVWPARLVSFHGCLACKTSNTASAMVFAVVLLRKDVTILMLIQSNPCHYTLSTLTLAPGLPRHAIKAWSGHAVTLTLAPGLPRHAIKAWSGYEATLTLAPGLPRHAIKAWPGYAATLTLAPGLPRHAIKAWPGYEATLTSSLQGSVQCLQYDDYKVVSGSWDTTCIVSTRHL